MFFPVHNLAQHSLLTKNTSLEKWVLASQHFPNVRKKTREQRWRIPAISSPVVALFLGPAESGCASRAEVALVVTRGLEGTRVTEGWDGFVPCLALWLPSPWLGSAV